MRPVALLATLVAALLPASVDGAVAAAAGGGPLALSGITSILVDSEEDVGAFDGTSYVRIVGTVSGRVAADEAVVGLAQQPTDGDGFVVWSSEFEIIRPADGSRFRTVVVEAENRGSPLMIQLFNRFLGGSGPPSSAEYPDGLGDGFLFDGRRAYARVQWQTGLSAGVPADAQGIGQIALRDFGRLLRDGVTVTGESSPLGRYRNRILTGWSQGAWMVNTFVAEGFNADPRRRRGVYDAALALAGAGNWLAINQLGDDGRPQDFYLRPEAAPLTPDELLTRPLSDPLFADVATYTDFYRLRAGVSGKPPPPRLWRGYRRYDWPAAHGPDFFVTDELVFQTLGCNEGAVVPLNPLDFRPYLRAVLDAIDRALTLPARRNRMPRSVRFALGPEPPPSDLFNGLPDRPVPVPLIDAQGQPVDGLRFPDVVAPLGALAPVSLPPVSTESINALCGNIGGYTPFTAEQVMARYGDVSNYLHLVTEQIDALIARGYLRAADRDDMIAAAEAAFEAAVAR